MSGYYNKILGRLDTLPRNLVISSTWLEKKIIFSKKQTSNHIFEWNFDVNNVIKIQCEFQIIENIQYKSGMFIILDWYLCVLSNVINESW